MKNFLLGLFVSVLVCIGVYAEPNSQMTFTEGITKPKPMALFLYADWADNLQQGLSMFNQMKSKYSDKYNFVTLDIASPDAKSFNKIYHIYPNLPYVLLFRDGTRFSRYINMDCIKDTSCFSTKLDVFVN